MQQYSFLRREKWGNIDYDNKSNEGMVIVEMKKVAVYQYISNEELQSEVYAFEQAIVPLRDWCDEKKYEVYFEYIDTKNSRTAMQELLIDMRRKRFQKVIVSSIEKLSNTRKDVRSIVHNLESNEIDLEVINICIEK